MSERCDQCHRYYLSVYRVPDDVWAKVSGRSDGGGLLCLECCDALARVNSRPLYWEAAVNRFPEKTTA